MTAPARIQLRREKGWRMPAGAVKVDRSTKFGNPFAICDGRDAGEAVSAFVQWLTIDGCDAGIPERKAALLAALPELRGRDLACWCRPSAPCHADALLALANAEQTP